MQRVLFFGKEHRIIIWLRKELRLHDNPCLEWAVKQTRLNPKKVEVLIVYCFDPEIYNRRNFKFKARKTGVIRAKFDLQAV